MDSSSSSSDKSQSSQPWNPKNWPKGLDMQELIKYYAQSQVLINSIAKSKTHSYPLRLPKISVDVDVGKFTKFFCETFRCK